MKVTQQRFLAYQAAFYREVEMADHVISLGFNADLGPSDDFLENFAGSNERKETEWYDFPVLSEENIDSLLRDRIGISALQNGTVYLSPLQIEAIFGTFELDYRKIAVKMNGHDYVVDKLEYLPKLYDSCIAIAITLKDAIQS